MGAASHIQAHPRVGWVGVGHKRVWVCLQREKSLQRRGRPQGQLLRAQVLRGRESGHVAGDGSEGVEQSGLHARLQEQQVHVDLL